MTMTKTSQSLAIMNQSVGRAVEMNVAHLHTEDYSLEGRYITVDGRHCLNFGSCSYLGLEMDPRLKTAAKDAVDRYGSQFSSSRAYVSLGLYEELEAHLAEMFQSPVIVTPTTTLGHLSAIPVLVGEGDAVILDHQVHASVNMAAQLLRARGIHMELIRHSNMEMLENRILKLRNKHRKIWYFGDGIYSMFGDYAPMAELKVLLDKYPQLNLYLDDAHGMSWTGPNGTGYVHQQLPRHERLYLTASLNKSFAAGGGVLVFPNEADKQLVRTCGGTLIFSGPLQPSSLGAGIASAKIHLSQEIDTLQASLLSNIQYFNQTAKEMGLTLLSPERSPIRFIQTGIPEVTLNVAARLKAMGFYANVAIYPSVPYKQSGLRITLTNHLRKEDLSQMLVALADQLPMAKEEVRKLELEKRSDFQLSVPIPV